jgi:hypothetical protein
MVADPPALGRRGWALAVAVASAATALFYFPAVAGQTFVGRDMLRVYAPLRAYWAARVGAGEFPDWFPYDGLGEPFPGLPFATTFHPVNALYLALPLDRALAWNTLLAVACAALGTFAFARRFGQAAGPAAFAGAAYAFSGYLVTITNNLSYLMAAATFPWALWGADRLLCRPGAGRLLAASALLALVLLAGDPQSFALCAAGAGALALVRRQPGLGRRAALLTLAVWAGAALLSAVQILPALVVRRSGMVAAYELAQAQEWSLHPLRLIEVALGPLFQVGGPHPADATIARSVLQAGLAGLWADSVHVGLPVLVLALFALRGGAPRTRWIALGSAVLLLGLALGRWGGLYELAHAVFPPWRSFRYPEKLFPFVAWLAAIGAGAGLHALEQDPARRAPVAWALLAAAAASGLLWAAEAGAQLWSGGLVGAVASGPLDPPAAARLRALFQDACLQTALICGLAFALVRWVRRGAWRSGLLAAAVWVHLLATDGRLFQTGSPDALRAPGEIARHVVSAGASGPGRERTFTVPSRVRLALDQDTSTVDQVTAARAGALEPAVGALWGIEPLSAYLPAASRRLAPLAALSAAEARRAAGVFSARWVIMDDLTFQKGGERAGAVRARDEAHALVLLEEPDFRPRAFLARPRCVATEEEAAAVAVGLAGRAPLARDEVAVVCGEALSASGAQEVRGEVEVRWPSPERVEASVRLEGPGLLVINDAAYEGWSAEVDGRPGEILAGNGVVRAIPLEAGSHRVLLRYRTPGMAAGAILSLFTLIAGLGGSAWEWMRRRTSP